MTDLRIATAALLAVLIAAPSAAQQLAVEHFDVSRGLSHNTVYATFEDSQGFLWFSTDDGLSRFDGFTFRTYGLADGLPHSSVNGVAEDRYGRLWIATRAPGLTRFADDGGAAVFVTRPVGGTHDSDIVNEIAVAADGALWCVTNAGVFRGMPQPNGDVAGFARVWQPDPLVGDIRILAGRRGDMWFGLDRVLLRVAAGEGGRVDRWGPDQPLTAFPITGVAESDGGVVVASNAFGLFRFAPDRHGDDVWQPIPMPRDVTQNINAIAFDSRGLLWIGTTRGVLTWDGRTVQAVSLAGVPPPRVESLKRDRSGAMWFGTTTGVVKLAHDRSVTYGASALPDLDVVKIVECPDGRLYASTQGAGLVQLFDDGSRRVRGLPDGPGRSFAQRVACDRAGRLWLAVDGGVVIAEESGGQLRNGRLALPATPQRDGGPYPAFSPDPEGGMWVGGFGDSVFRFALPHAAGAVPERRQFGVDDGMGGIARVARDAAGAVWLSAFGGIARVRDGRVLLLDAKESGLAALNARALLVDSRGWVWLGFRYTGVAVTRDPGAERPTFQSYTTRDGVRGSYVETIAEGTDGRIYFGSGQGVDRFDPATGTIRPVPLTVDLAGARVRHLWRDRQGRLWMATSRGVARLPQSTPGADAAPTTRLMGVRVSGARRQVSERGATTLPALSLGPADNSLAIDFVSLGFAGEAAPRYQYRLEGIDRDWSAPSESRTVNYSNLAPGPYRFFVRGVGETGRVAAPATLQFVIAAPVWRRPWFAALAAGLFLSAGVALYRIRVRHILAMERIRRQVAFDLHDDLGAGLSEIAILSEAAGDEAPPGSRANWQSVATLARTLRQSMDDIVWAVDPRRDTVADLLQRMKQVAFHLLESARVRVVFSAPPAPEIASIAMAPDRRRHLLLFFKEAVHNIARHSGASRIDIAVKIDGRTLRLEIADDGRGFDPAQESPGHGLASLQHRAGLLGAALDLETAIGAGTRIGLAVPLQAPPAQRGRLSGAPSGE